MNQPQTGYRRIQFLLFLFIMIQAPAVQSQRIFTSTGILASIFNNATPMETYDGIVVRSSLGLGFETKQWHRLSFTALFSHFTSGGKRSSKGYGFSDFKEYDHLYFNNYSIGAIGNFYMVNRKTQFYLGVGPRIDYVRSQQPMYAKWDGTSNFLNKIVFGVSGNIGVNFQIDNFNLGIKSTYYYRPYLYKSTYQTYYGESSSSAQDYVFDLQLVFGYTLGRRKSVE